MAIAPEASPGAVRQNAQAQLQPQTQPQPQAQAQTQAQVQPEAQPLDFDGAATWVSVDADADPDSSTGDNERFTTAKTKSALPTTEPVMVGERRVPRSSVPQTVETRPSVAPYSLTDEVTTANPSAELDTTESFTTESVQRVAVSSHRPGVAKDAASSESDNDAPASTVVKPATSLDTATRMVVDGAQGVRLSDTEALTLATGRESRPQGLNHVGGVGEHATQQVASQGVDPSAPQPARNVISAPAIIHLEEPVSPEAIREVAVRTVRFSMAQGENSVTIRLSPESLGDMVVEVKSSHEALHVRITASAPTVREALEGQVHGLREALAREGIHATTVSVAADPGQGHSAAQYGGRQAFAGEGGRGGLWSQPQTYREATQHATSTPRPAPRGDSSLDLYA